jgi:hypothetical protein
MKPHKENIKASSKSKQNKLHRKEGEVGKQKTNQERTQTETERNENISLFAQKQSKEYNNVKTRNRVELEREQGSNGRTQPLRNDDGSTKRRRT